MNSFCRHLRNSRQREVYFFNVHSLTVCLEESHNVVDCCHLETQALPGTLVHNISKALAGTLVYNISRALLGRLGAWMESEMSGVVSSLGDLDAEQQCKYIHCLVLVSCALIGQECAAYREMRQNRNRSQTMMEAMKKTTSLSTGHISLNFSPRQSNAFHQLPTKRQREGCRWSVSVGLGLGLLTGGQLGG